MLMTVGLLAATPVAPAAENGVTVDRDSPAGKEYALPFPQAREKGAGGEGSPGEGTSGSAAGSAAQAADPPLFGVGISSPGGVAVDVPGSDGSIGSAPPLPPGSAQPPVPSSGGGGSATLITGAIVAAVLLAGTVIGLGLRRRAA